MHSLELNVQESKRGSADISRESSHRASGIEVRAGVRVCVYIYINIAICLRRASLSCCLLLVVAQTQEEEETFESAHRTTTTTERDAFSKRNGGGGTRLDASLPMSREKESGR